MVLITLFSSFFWLFFLVFVYFYVCTLCSPHRTPFFFACVCVLKKAARFCFSFVSPILISLLDFISHVDLIVEKGKEKRSCFCTESVLCYNTSTNQSTPLFFSSSSFQICSTSGLLFIYSRGIAISPLRLSMGISRLSQFLLLNFTAVKATLFFSPFLPFYLTFLFVLLFLFTKPLLCKRKQPFGCWK